MLDHIGLAASDLDRSKAFYTAALAPLGYRIGKDFGVAVGFGVAAGASDAAGDFWISRGAAPAPGIHVAFSAASRAQVDAFYQSAIAAGAKDNGPPGLRPHYHANYYATFVLDPDGYNIEVVCHAPV